MKAFARSLIMVLIVLFTIGLHDSIGRVQADSVQTPIHLGFEPHDTAIDPKKSVIYMTKFGSKTLYAVNFTTGAVRTLALPSSAERLELYDGKLYVTQHKMSHDWYNFGAQSGAIAEIDTQEFKLSHVMDVNIDPYDIAIDDNGYIYISPGSGQWSHMKVYSLRDKVEIPNLQYTQMRAQSYIYYNSETSKVYSISTDTSPRDVEAFEVKDGMIKNKYDSPYHGDYELEPYAKISSDGLHMYNNSGVVFDLTTFKSGDMHFSFDLGEDYNDYAFSLKDQLTFAASVDGGIDVYKYGTDEYLYSIKQNLHVKKLHFQNGLVAIYEDGNGKEKVEYIRDYGPEALQFLEGIAISHNADGDTNHDNFYHKVKNVPVESMFELMFNQPVKLEDGTKISIKGPDGFVKVHNEVSDGVLMIEPELLKENTTYTLKMKKEAISGYLGMHLPNDIVIEFKTKSTKTGWVQMDGKWYYYSPTTGEKEIGWNEISGTWYYFNNNGEMRTGWEKVNHIWYYLEESGAMKTGWLKSGSAWYYLEESGAMKTGWLKSGSAWYYLEESGAMKTGWLKSGSTWYYLEESGAMKTGWLNIGGTWYYFYSSGEMAHNTRIDGHKIGSDGAWIK
ncbi:hypothetical protein [Bacillus cereus]|uniref:hypothetical protein n=1 Tax=Bacillus cereus TaxID=1396 RepID=UPI003980E4EE